MANYFNRTARLKSSVRGRLKICPTPLQRQVFIEEVALYLNILQKKHSLNMNNISVERTAHTVGTASRPRQF